MHTFHVHYIIVYFPLLGSVEPPTSNPVSHSLFLCVSLPPFLITDSALSQRISTRYRDIKVAFPSDICASRNAGNSSRDSLFLLPRLFARSPRINRGKKNTRQQFRNEKQPNISARRGHLFFLFSSFFYVKRFTKYAGVIIGTDVSLSLSLSLSLLARSYFKPGG